MKRLTRVIKQLFILLLCTVILSTGWTSIALAAAPIACAEDMKKNAVVITAIQDAWEDSQVNDKDKRHEEGGWILQNIATGELMTIRVPSGTRDRLNLGNLPVKEGWQVIGFFHTHPSPSKDEFGNEWEPGPSSIDVNAANSVHLPGLVFNRYTSTPMSFGPPCPPTPTTTTTTTTTTTKTGLSGVWISRVAGNGYVLEWLNGPFTWYYDIVMTITPSGNTFMGTEEMTLRNVILTPGQENFGGVQEQFDYWKGQAGTTTKETITGTISGNTISIPTKYPSISFSLTNTGDKLYGITNFSGVGINYKSTFDLKRK